MASGLAPQSDVGSNRNRELFYALDCRKYLASDHRQAIHASFSDEDLFSDEDFGTRTASRSCLVSEFVTADPAAVVEKMRVDRRVRVG
jgi:hypothetical protein